MKQAQQKISQQESAEIAPREENLARVVTGFFPGMQASGELLRLFAPLLSGGMTYEEHRDYLVGVYAD